MGSSAFYKEPPVARFLDHFLIFMIYALLGVAGWVIYGQADAGLRAGYFSYAIILTVLSSIAAFGALVDHFQFEFAVLPPMIAFLLIYALALLTEPVEFHGVLIMVAFAFVKADRFLHLWIVSKKLRAAKALENGPKHRN